MSKAKEEPQSELLYRMSRVVGHEIRNPMAVIKNSAYFVKAKLSASGGVDPKIEKHLAIIESEIARADKIIADIVSYARPGELKFQPSSVNDLVSEAVATLALPANVTLEKKLAAGGPEVPMDRDAMKAVVAVLLNNALEAVGEGGKIKVSTRVEKGQAVIEVADSGKGIKPEDKPKLFLPFFTTKPRGLGLGLTGALRTVLGHSGKLDVESSAAGATFTVSLPSK